MGSEGHKRHPKNQKGRKDSREGGRETGNTYEDIIPTTAHCRSQASPPTWGKNKALILQPLKNVRRGCWQNFFILKSKSVIRRFQRCFHGAQSSSPVNGPLSPGWSWRTETRWCPSLSHIHSFIHYLPGHLRRRPGKAGSRILKKRESVCLVFTVVVEYLRLPKRRNGYGAGGFSPWSAGSMASRPGVRQKYHHGRAWWGNLFSL